MKDFDTVSRPRGILWVKIRKILEKCQNFTEAKSLKP